MSEIKTLLLCFIHGFKGDEETFYEFPSDLKNQVKERNPGLNVESRVYPKYETKGDLAGCVETFRDWLQDQVTDLERDAATPSAILNPSVSVILVAHSMGGFVAADTLFTILSNRPQIAHPPNQKLLFPLVSGLISYDTPYNGLSRSMFAYGAFSQYQNLSSAWNLLSTVGSTFGSSTAVSAAGQTASWARWQALASRTGTYGAIVAGGVAVYMNRDYIRESLGKINRESIKNINYRESVTSGVSQGLTYVSKESIGEGFAWLAGHLKFVGALMKQAQLTTRLERLEQLEGIGRVNFYTTLGQNGYWTGGYFVPKRMFCAVPTEKEKASWWIECVNKKAKNEIEAHCRMFRRETNEGYDEMMAKSVELVGKWVKNDPRKVKDEYKPTREQLSRRQSEAQLWDDDGKVLKPKMGDEDADQLQAILRCSEMPQGEDGGVDEEELKKATQVPLPVDDEVVNNGKVDNGGLEKAAEVPLPAGDL